MYQRNHPQSGSASRPESSSYLHNNHHPNHHQPHHHPAYAQPLPGQQSHPQHQTYCVSIRPLSYQQPPSQPVHEWNRAGFINELRSLGLPDHKIVAQELASRDRDNLGRHLHSQPSSLYGRIWERERERERPPTSVAMERRQ